MKPGLLDHGIFFQIDFYRFEFYYFWQINNTKLRSTV